MSVSLCRVYAFVHVPFHQLCILRLGTSVNLPFAWLCTCVRIHVPGILNVCASGQALGLFPISELINLM